MNKYLHIVCPEIPGPASTADMTDTYYQIQFLYNAGYRLMVHCFQNDPATVPADLEAMVSGLFLYERNQGHKGVSIRLPYCISSRSNSQLLQNLQQQPGTVIFQGIATTFYLPHLAAHHYNTIVRINGIASEVYEAFTRCGRSLFKKAYSYNEARLIRRWEEKISEHAIIVTTTPADRQRFSELHKKARVHFIPPFIPVPEIKSIPGKGMYCLYYGDLSNPENEQMVAWLSENVFRRIPVPFIVADTAATVRTPVPEHPESNICVVSNPDEAALKELIQKAQVIVLPRCHNKGFDKRLVPALAVGRHCICNDLMVQDTGLEKFCIVANESEEFIQAINHYFCRHFSAIEILERSEWLSARCQASEGPSDYLKLINTCCPA